jgi:hypothetical protein
VHRIKYRKEQGKLEDALERGTRYKEKFRESLGELDLVKQELNQKSFDDTTSTAQATKDIMVNQ